MEKPEKPEKNQAPVGLVAFHFAPKCRKPALFFLGRSSLRG